MLDLNIDILSVFEVGWSMVMWRVERRYTNPASVLRSLDPIPTIPFKHHAAGQEVVAPHVTIHCGARIAEVWLVEGSVLGALGSVASALEGLSVIKLAGAIVVEFFHNRDSIEDLSWAYNNDLGGGCYRQWISPLPCSSRFYSSSQLISLRSSSACSSLMWSEMNSWIA